RSTAEAATLVGEASAPLRSLFHVRDDRRDRNRPAHPARGVPPPARGRPCRVPARVGRARPPRAPLLRRPRLADRRLRRRRAARGGDEHLRRIERAQEHIREGDVFQVVIAQRAERPTSASAFELYRALRRVNPSPYLFLLELEELALVGSSPETVVKCEGRR